MTVVLSRGTDPAGGPVTFMKVRTARSVRNVHVLTLHQIHNGDAAGSKGQVRNASREVECFVVVANIVRSRLPDQKRNFAWREENAQNMGQGETIRLSGRNCCHLNYVFSTISYLPNEKGSLKGGEGKVGEANFSYCVCPFPPHAPGSGPRQVEAIHHFFRLCLRCCLGECRLGLLVVCMHARTRFCRRQHSQDESGRKQGSVCAPLLLHYIDRSLSARTSR